MGFGWWWSISDSLATISSKYRNQRHTRRGKPQDYFKYINPVLPLNYFSWFSLKCSQLNVSIYLYAGAGSRNKQNLSKKLKMDWIVQPHQIWSLYSCDSSHTWVLTDKLLHSVNNSDKIFLYTNKTKYIFITVPCGAYPGPKTRFLCLFRIENHQFAIRRTRPRDSPPGTWISYRYCVRIL